jgi:asparagine synthase (glutamine-hydrolysing)
MGAVDFSTYLRDCILVKVDRASMATSLEARCPLLDRSVVEFAWSLPAPLRYRGATGKLVLREVLQRYVPRELYDRPKQGFGVPIGDWLRGDLRDWAESLLAEQSLRDEGYFRVGAVRRAWDQHQTGLADHSTVLWSILAFQAWNRERP